jgi:hypothetical protein
LEQEKKPNATKESTHEEGKLVRAIERLNRGGVIMKVPELQPEMTVGQVNRSRDLARSGQRIERAVF